jgi:endonuclease-3
MLNAQNATRVRVRLIIRRLERAYPEARIALDFTTPLELLVATILAAQCTDERVNQVTKSLFQQYRTAQDYAEADPAALEDAIRSTGFYRAKTRSLIGMGRALAERHGGVVPRERDALTALPGVGLKTANVVRGNAFGEPAIAVDTHVFRIARRLGLARADDPDRVHDELVAVVPRARWTRFCHLLQAHGRAVCTALKPSCPVCPIRQHCPWPATRATPGAGGRPGRGGGRPTRGSAPPRSLTRRGTSSNV